MAARLLFRILIPVCTAFVVPTCLGIAYRHHVEPGPNGTSTAGALTGSKTGRACATSVLALVATGDCSIEKATAQGKITMIRSIEYEMTSYLMFFLRERCVIVTGD